MQSTVWLEQMHELIRTEPMRVVVEEYPAVMPVLSQYGFDLCCGGGHSIGEAARLHGLDPQSVVKSVIEVILKKPN